MTTLCVRILGLFWRISTSSWIRLNGLALDRRPEKVNKVIMSSALIAPLRASLERKRAPLAVPSVVAAAGELPSYMQGKEKVDFNYVRRLLRSRGLTQSIIVSMCGVTMPAAKAFLAGSKVRVEAWFRIRQILNAEELFHLKDLSKDEYQSAVALEFFSVTRGMDSSVVRHLENQVSERAASMLLSPVSVVSQCVSQLAPQEYSPGNKKTG